MKVHKVIIGLLNYKTGKALDVNVFCKEFTDGDSVIDWAVTSFEVIEAREIEGIVEEDWE